MAAASDRRRRAAPTPAIGQGGQWGAAHHKNELDGQSGRACPLPSGLFRPGSSSPTAGRNGCCCSRAPVFPCFPLPRDVTMPIMLAIKGWRKGVGVLVRELRFFVEQTLPPLQNGIAVRTGVQEGEATVTRLWRLSPRRSGSRLPPPPPLSSLVSRTGPWSTKTIPRLLRSTRSASERLCAWTLIFLATTAPSQSDCRGAAAHCPAPMHVQGRKEGYHQGAGSAGQRVEEGCHQEGR